MDVVPIALDQSARGAPFALRLAILLLISPSLSAQIASVRLNLKDDRLWSGGTVAVREFLTAAGLHITQGGQADATLDVELNVVPLSQRYSISGFYPYAEFYTGAIVRGTLSLRHSRREVKKKFSGKISPPGDIQVRFPQSVQGSTPTSAPFVKAFNASDFVVALGQVIQQSFGPDTAVRYWLNVLARDSLRSANATEFISRTDLLAKALVRDKEPSVRAEAACYLGAKESGALLAALKDPDAYVRASAVRRLGEVNGSASLDPIERLMQSDPIPLVRLAAIDARVKLQDPPLTLLLSFLGDPLVDIRVRAAQSLGKLKDSAAVGPMIEQMRDQPYRAERAIANALASITGQQFGVSQKAWAEWWESQPSQSNP